MGTVFRRPDGIIYGVCRTLYLIQVAKTPSLYLVYRVTKLS